MAYILKPSTKLTIDPNQKIWGVNNHLPIINSADGDLVLPTQQGSIVDVIREKAEEELREKLGDDLPSDNPYITDTSTSSSDTATDDANSVTQGTQTDSSSLSDTALTIDELNQKLNSLGGKISDWETFYNLMVDIYQRARAGSTFSSDSARLAISEKIADMVYNFTLSVYSNAMQSQMWYEQQYYNSPAMQLQRLADAGLVGMASQISTGNAQSAANSTEPAPAEQSNAAEMVQADKTRQIEQAKMFLEAVKAPTELGVNIGQAWSVAEQAKTYHQMRPYEVMQAAKQVDLITAQIDDTKQSASLKASQRFANECGVIFQKYDLLNGLMNTKHTILQGWTGLENQMFLGLQGFKTQKDIAEMNNAASIQAASIGYSASKYSADKSLEGTQIPYQMVKQKRLVYYKVGKGGQVEGRVEAGTDLFKMIQGKVGVGGTYEFNNENYTCREEEYYLPLNDAINNLQESLSNPNGFDTATNVENYLLIQQLSAQRMAKGWSDFVNGMVDKRFKGLYKQLGVQDATGFVNKYGNKYKTTRYGYVINR